MTQTLVFSMQKTTHNIQIVLCCAAIYAMLYPFDYISAIGAPIVVPIVMVFIILVIAIVKTMDDHDIAFVVSLKIITGLLAIIKFIGYLLCSYLTCNESWFIVGCIALWFATLVIAILWIILNISTSIFIEWVKPHMQNVKIGAWELSAILLTFIIMLGFPIGTHPITDLTKEERIMVCVGLMSYFTLIISLKTVTDAGLKTFAKSNFQDWLVMNLVMVFWATILGSTSIVEYIFGLQPLTYARPNIITFSKGIQIFAWPVVISLGIGYLVVSFCFETVETPDTNIVNDKK